MVGHVITIPKHPCRRPPLFLGGRTAAIRSLEHQRGIENITAVIGLVGYARRYWARMTASCRQQVYYSELARRMRPTLEYWRPGLPALSLERWPWRPVSMSR
jgi:hypothetical protein